MANFIISIVLIHYRKTKEELSGEKHLTGPQRFWLRIKTYILSLEPERRKRFPAHCFRSSLYQVCSHRAYKILQGIIVVSFLIVSSLYRVSLDAEAKELFWKGVSFYIAVVLLDYLMNLIAFGYDPRCRSCFILDTCICLYLIIGYSLRQSSIL